MNITEQQFREMIERAKAADAYSREMSVIETLTLDQFLAQKELPSWLCWYALYVIGGRWPEAEPVIAQHAESAYWYALYVIEGRWPEAEPVIEQDAYYAYCYARDVIEGRWMNNKMRACARCRGLHDRGRAAKYCWKCAAEQYIARSRAFRQSAHDEGLCITCRKVKTDGRSRCQACTIKYYPSWIKNPGRYLRLREEKGAILNQVDALIRDGATESAACGLVSIANNICKQTVLRWRRKARKEKKLHAQTKP